MNSVFGMRLHQMTSGAHCWKLTPACLTRRRRAAGVGVVGLAVAELERAGAHGRLEDALAAGLG